MRNRKKEVKILKSRDMKGRWWGVRNGGRRASIDSRVSERELTRGQEEGKEVGGKRTEAVNNRTPSVWEQENGGQKYRRVKSPGEEKFSGGSIWAKCQLMCLY